MIAPAKIRESLDKKTTYNHVHKEQLSICDVLEEIADSLPDRIDKAVCIQTAIMLPQIIARAHSYEEDILFPLLEKSKNSVIDLKSTLIRLRLEHVGDKCFAEELAEVLMSYGAGVPNLAAEATGYMLRGFFEALRRHVAFERELFFSVLDMLEV